MVTDVIPTSAWAHNCGMHVVADYFIEHIKQSHDLSAFTGGAYDALLTAFQKEYQQANLTWKKIQAHTLKANRADAQIIWGYVLRTMLPALLTKDVAYKQDLATEFLAALKLFKEGKLEELQESYPLILQGNVEYFKTQALGPNALEETELQYWHDKGFGDTCTAIMTLPTGSENFLWLGQEELTLFCRYFNIELVMVDYARNLVYDPKKIYFLNWSETHWERYVERSAIEKEQQTQAPSFFYKERLDKGVKTFITQIKTTGTLFFSDLYREPQLGLELINLPASGLWKKHILNKDKPGFIDFIKKNKIQKTEYGKFIGFTGAHFNSDELMMWLKDPETSAIFLDCLDEILLSTVKHQKIDTFDRLTTDFSDKITVAMCMPALLLATKNDVFYMAYPLLARLDLTYEKINDFNYPDITPAFLKVINQYDKNNTPALYYAIKNKNSVLVHGFLLRGACVTYLVDNKNALQWALETEHAETILLLCQFVSAHSLSSSYNASGDNVFHVFSKNRDIISLEKVNDIVTKENNGIMAVRTVPGLESENIAGMNCLHVMASMGYLKGVEYCVEKNLSLYSQDKEGNAPLHFAVLSGQLDTVKYLIKKIAEYNQNVFFSSSEIELSQKNKQNQSALDLAYEHNFWPIIRYFKTIGYVDVVQEFYAELTQANKNKQSDVEVGRLHERNQT